MAQGKKFGTFGGVFTPSILTILGVIMYLRMPWIVGNAGLWLTIGIIVVAHIISFTTGLSVASIATDKKVKVGGNYYIISRSMGLPIGGTLGIALFVGFSFSISLYLIGFSESFLAYWGWEVTEASIRICGTIALLLVGTISFISTSLAIKTQYFIMAAIALSLISILFGSSDFVPAEPLLAAPAEGPPLMLLFGIFFPAVTGFTTGVQMSGDLKNPQRSLPVGTIASIVVGMLVYIGLTVFLVYRVDAAQLRGNESILLDMSLWTPLVVAGIWGATLSSAMGSILGAPRILQATSMDRITPRFFAKGYGKTNEPRNALVMAAIIAQCGILIGELNAIASVVSMFFITTYGFLNVSFAIENWASSDFRPSFRIPTWVGILGAVTCLVVMVNLNLFATILALVALGLLFGYLKRRELTLESGDTWEGVWSSVVRAGLHRLNRGVTHQRNWRPNILLFSGTPSTRPYLMNFGAGLTHKRGILTIFDLVENSQTEGMFRLPDNKADAAVTELPGIFSRRLECSDIYSGMETIIRVYGFAGIEPNTILMGWARQSRQPDRFAQLVRLMKKLDYNTLLMDYDRERGYGNQKQIDIWWRGGSNNATLQLTVLKFLQNAEGWGESQARILIVVDSSAQTGTVQRRMMRLLEEQRINAGLKVINNSVERRPFHEILQRESFDADLTMIGMPRLTEGNVHQFVATTDSIVANIGTVLLVSASSFFDPLDVGVERSASPDELPPDPAQTGAEPLLPLQEAPAQALGAMYKRLAIAIEEFGRTGLGAIEANIRSFESELQALLDRNCTALVKSQGNGDPVRLRRMINRSRSSQLFQLRKLLDQQAGAGNEMIRDAFDHGLALLHEEAEAVRRAAPQSVAVNFEESEVRIRPKDGLALRLLKLRKRLSYRINKQTITLDANVGQLADYEYRYHFAVFLRSQMEAFGVASYTFANELQQWISAMQDGLEALAGLDRSALIESDAINKHYTELGTRLSAIAERLYKQCRTMAVALSEQHHKRIETMTSVILSPDCNIRIWQLYKIPPAADAVWPQLLEIPARWAENFNLSLNYARLGLALSAFRNRADVIVRKSESALAQQIRDQALEPLLSVEKRLRQPEQGAASAVGIVSPALPSGGDRLNLPARLDEMRDDLLSAIRDLPESIELIADESLQRIEQQQFEDLERVTVTLRRLVEFVMESELMLPLQQELAGLPERLRHSLNVARDTLRLVQFQLSQAAESDAQEGLFDATLVPLDVVVDTNLRRLEDEQQDVRQALDNFHERLNALLATAFEKLNPYLLTRDAGKLGQYIRSQESRKVLKEVEAGTRRLRRFVSRLMVRLLYRSSEGFIFARKLGKLERSDRSNVDAVRDFVDAVSPRPELLEALPFYYRQLFLAKQPMIPEFRVGCDGPLQKADRALQRYRNGVRGGILVLGEAGSGKSELCRTIALRFTSRQHIVQLASPPYAVADLDFFRQWLRKALQDEGSPEEMLSALPNNSCIVLNDLEMWWERSPDGFAVINELLRLITMFSERCLFIVNTSSHSFRFLNRWLNIEDAFLASIECEAFDARELQEAILLRHRSTGLSFELKATNERDLSDFALARLFNKIFHYSAGNIGVALQAWISSASALNENRITVTAPVRPALDALETLDKEWLAWLLHIALHKRLREESLTRAFRCDPAHTASMIDILLRAGLLHRSDQQALELHASVRPFLLRTFYETQLL